MSESRELTASVGAAITAFGSVLGAIGDVLPYFKHLSAWTTVTGAATVLYVIRVLFSARKTRDMQREAAARRIVNTLHRRWFPGECGELDRGHRVALYAPVPSAEAPREWLCLARTTTDRKAKSWPHIKKEDKKYPNFGSIVFTAVEGAETSVSGMPAGTRGDLSRRDKYIRNIKTTHEEWRTRSWPYASIMTRYARAPTGTISCVLCVEREDGLSIQMDSQVVIKTGQATQTLALCPWELQLAAEIWVAYGEQK